MAWPQGLIQKTIYSEYVRHSFLVMILQYFWKIACLMACPQGFFQKSIVSEYEDVHGYFWFSNTINFILIQSNLNPHSEVQA